MAARRVFPGNVNARLQPPFRQVPIRQRSLTEAEVRAHRVVSTDPILRFFEQMFKPFDDGMMALASAFEEDSRCLKIATGLSMLASLVHIPIQIWALTVFDSGSKFALMIILLVIVILFFIFNCLYCNPFVCFSSFYKPRWIMYMVALCLYLILFCIAASFMVDEDNVLLVVSCIVFVLSVNILGIIGLLYILLKIALLIVYGIASLFCCCRFKCCYKVPEDGQERDHHLYYYDGARTDVKACSICLQDYLPDVLIRICLTHQAHIFHDECIALSLQRSKNCPLCRTPIRFH